VPWRRCREGRFPQLIGHRRGGRRPSTNRPDRERGRRGRGWLVAYASESQVRLQVLRIRALARRKPTARSRTFQAGGIELDPLTGIVTRDGRTIELRAKERAVLEALLKASPGVLSAEQLLAQAWDENVDPFTNTVRVTIARLRRKLGPPDIIHTTPGLGYRISETP
jgi:DNA-binding response OmpR family regulator